MSRLEEELRTRSAEYQNISGNLAASERKEACVFLLVPKPFIRLCVVSETVRSGSLLVRQLGDIIAKAELLNTEYIATLLVVVPKYASRVSS